MSSLPTRSFDGIVGTIAAGMQGRIGAFLDFAIGTWLRGIAEAFAGIVLWLQKVALDIVKLTRLATSSGSDIDTFIADFPLSGVTRLGAQAATGQVVFGRFSPAASAPVVSVGTVVQTLDGSQRFAVYTDTTNGAYSAVLNGYVMAAQTVSVTAPVQAIVPGSAGNVAAGAIAAIGANAPSGISTVNNVVAFTNGIDSESDDSVVGRFHLAVQGRGGGTEAAIKSAVANLKAGMSSVVLSGQNLDGSANPGMVSVIVDDGSGNLSASLLAAAQSAVNDVHAAGIRFGVYAATTTAANVVMQISTRTGYIHATVVAQVVAALGLYINGLGQGVGLAYFDLPAIAKAVPGVLEVLPQAYSLNGSTSDIPGTAQSTIKAGSLVVS